MVTKPGQLRWTHLSGDNVCRKQGGVQWLVSCDLSNVMHRDSAVEGGAIKHEKGDLMRDIYISEPMDEL